MSSSEKPIDKLFEEITDPCQQNKRGNGNYIHAIALPVRIK